MARELVEERQNLLAPRRVEGTVHLQPHAAHAHGGQCMLNLVHRLRRNRERQLLRGERERPLDLLRRESRQHLLQLLGTRGDHRHQHALRQSRMGDGVVHDLVGLTQELQPALAVELPPQQASRDQGVQIATRESHRPVRTDTHHLEDSRQGRVRRIGRDNRLRIATGSEHVRVMAIVRRRRENEGRGLEEPLTRQGGLELIEWQTALAEPHCEVAEHIRVEGRSPGEHKGQLPLGSLAKQMTAEIVGAALVADTCRPATDTVGGGDQPSPQISHGLHDQRKHRPAVRRENLRAGIGHIPKRHARSLVEKPHEAIRRIRERRVVHRAEEHQLAAEGLAEIRVHARSSIVGSSSRTSAARRPLKSPISTIARRGELGSPVIQGRGSFRM